MPTIRKFEDLEIWQLARIQAQEIFTLTKQNDFARDFDLKNQINRSAGSVMDYIAEGFERMTNKEFCNFLTIAKGSNGEVRSQLYRAFDKQYFSNEVLAHRISNSEIIGNKIVAFIRYLSSSPYLKKPI